eukprot:1299086-Pyramimonas_sp.AAC.1
MSARSGGDAQRAAHVRARRQLPASGPPDRQGSAQAGRRGTASGRPGGRLARPRHGREHLRLPARSSKECEGLCDATWSSARRAPSAWEGCAVTRGSTAS